MPKTVDDPARKPSPKAWRQGQEWLARAYAEEQAATPPTPLLLSTHVPIPALEPWDLETFVYRLFLHRDLTTASAAAAKSAAKTRSTADEQNTTAKMEVPLIEAAVEPISKEEEDDDSH